MYAADFAAVPGKLELTVRLTRVMLPFLVAVAVAAALMGMLNSLHHYFVPGALARDFQRRDDRRRVHAGAAHARARMDADHGDRDWR